MTSIFSKFFVITLLSFAFSSTSFAENKNVPKGDLMPPSSGSAAGSAAENLNSPTHPALNLMPDKSELVRLDREAASVVIGNPAHISVILDTPKLAVVVPRSPGATYLSILDKNGEVIMQRHITVAAPKKNYVRIRRSCAGAATGTTCQPTSVYYCPDTCHEVGSVEQADEGASSAE